MSVLAPLLLLLSGAAAPPPPALAEEAVAEVSRALELREDAARARPHLRRAVQALEQLRNQGVGNVSLYRLEGAACLLADDLAGAVLACRRGLRLAPDDPVLRTCLAEARERIGLPADSPYRYREEQAPFWLPTLRPWWLGGAAFLAYLAGCVGVTRWLMTRRGRPLVVGLAALILAAAPGYLLARDLRAEREMRAHPLVVIRADGVLLRRGDGLAYPPRYEAPLAAGVEARLLFERPGWLQVELPAGEVGWIPAEHALVDRPGP